jgi:hypothetical protein
MLSLTLPEICAALAQPDGRTQKSKHYKAWYNKYLADTFPHLSADDCYSLTCGVIHQGKIGILKSGIQYDRVLFLIRQSGNIFEFGKLSVSGGGQNALTFDTISFCERIADAVRDWFATAQHDPVVQRNIPNLFQYRPMGLSPFLVGLPVLA